MSEQPGRESLETELGSVSLDDEDQLQPEDTLVEAEDGAAEPWSPPDSRPRATEWGTTAYEETQRESIEQRIMQEVPEEDSAYGAPGEPREGVRARESADDEGPEQAAMHVTDGEDGASRI